MTKMRYGVVMVALCATFLPVIPGPVGAEGPAVEPEALDLLERMTDYLGGLEKFSVHTDNMLEDVLVSGQKIQYDFTAHVQIQRPNKLRAVRTGDLFRQELIYDGVTLTLFNPEDGYFAKTKAPGDIDSLLHFARDTLDIVPPTGDIIYSNAYELLTAGLTEGFVVGKSLVGGVLCDHLAFRTPLVDWQIWIADGEKPLPYKYVLTTMDDPAHPQYLVLMSDWNTRTSFAPGRFEFSEPAGAKEIEFLRMDVGSSTMD